MLTFLYRVKPLSSSLLAPIYLSHYCNSVIQFCRLFLQFLFTASVPEKYFVRVY
jgi:hypothetical protein